MLLVTALLLSFAISVAFSEGRVHHECRKAGHIAFTFDQGPSQYTGILLTALDKAGAKATFHVTADYLDNPVLSANLRRAAAEGHLIGIYVKESAANKEHVKGYLENCTRRIKQYINYEPTFLRFAANKCSPDLVDLVTSLGYHVTGYNLDSQDYNCVGATGASRRAAQAASRNMAVDETNRGAVYRTIKDILDLIVPPTLGSFIVVQRDLVRESVLQSQGIVEYAQKRGYKPVRLDECIGVYAGDEDLGKDPGSKSDDSTGVMARVFQQTAGAERLLVSWWLMMLTVAVVYQIQ